MISLSHKEMVYLYFAAKVNEAFEGHARGAEVGLRADDPQVYDAIVAWLNSEEKSDKVRIEMQDHNQFRVVLMEMAPVMDMTVYLHSDRTMSFVVNL